MSRLHVAAWSAGGALTGYLAYCGIRKQRVKGEPKNLKALLMSDDLSSREKQVKRLQTEEFDLLVIGGGATGAGCVLDAQTRGLKAALVEKFDFSSGTSSRSTKLIHGGVRYLQKAVFNLDRDQYYMVKEALNERATLVNMAPHLAYPFPIMLPIYKYWQVPYYWAGIKLYDLVAGAKNLKSSYYIGKKKALELFPMLRHESLVGALVYYDGQQNDARMNLSLIVTAARYGAATANYTQVTSLLTRPQKTGKSSTEEESKEVVCGALVKDRLTGVEYQIKAKSVINATGPYTDQVRTMTDSSRPKICQPSSGTHIILPNYYSPNKMGLLDPSTSDGRVIFFLPWQNSTIAGTTDTKCELTDNPSPTESEVTFILKEIRSYLNDDVQVRRGDVLSAWSGIRPLVMDPSKPDTQSLARNHIIEADDKNLVTIAGGKWTTYRHMAEEAVDKAVEVCGLEPSAGCCTESLKLEGAHGWTPTMYIRLVQEFGLDSKVAEHLGNTYGDKAFEVARLAKLTGDMWPVVGRKLHPNYPYIEAEVRYAVKEQARRALDIIARRTRLAFLNVTAAEQALPKIVEIMGEELGWSKQKKKEELDYCKVYLQKEMGLDLAPDYSNVIIALTLEEMNTYHKLFRKLDRRSKGFITNNDFRAHLQEVGHPIPDEQLRDIMKEVDVCKNGVITLGEFLQVMSAIKTGVIANSRFASAARKSQMIPTERSGGGV